MAELESTTPLVRSDIMIEYGTVEIGGRTYIGPVRSVSISGARSVTLLTEWDESYRTYGPFETMLNDVAFDGYHLFRAKARMLTGFNPAPEEKSVSPTTSVRAALPFLRPTAPAPLLPRNAAFLRRIGLDEAATDRQVLALHQSHVHALPHDLLK